MDSGGPDQASSSRTSWWTFLAAGLFAGIGAVVVYETFLRPKPLEIPQRELRAGELEQLLALARTPVWTLNNAEQVAKTYGSGAVPYLRVEVQNTSNPARMRGTLSYFLGVYRDDAAAPVIRDFVESLFERDLSPAEKSGIAMALDGLGLIGNEAALAQLESYAGEAYWLDRGAVDSARQLIRSRAIYALGLAPNGSGIAHLKRLRAALEDESLAADAEAALKRARRARWDFGIL